jgi:hypothetical protein
MSQKMAKRDDPFCNANLLGFIIFCIVIQKYIIFYAFTTLMGYHTIREETLIVIRQTIVAIELLFIIIPIRHNFSLDHVET